MKLFSEEQINKIWEMQKSLDDFIRENNGIDPEEDLNQKKYLALKTEIFEMVNEIECFKFWKKNKGKDHVLEEACDALHFIFSLAIDNEIDLTPSAQEMEEMENLDLEQYEMNELITFMDDTIGGCYFVPNWSGLKMVIMFLLVIINKCGFDVDDLFRAYMDKNKVNIERQQVNY